MNAFHYVSELRSDIARKTSRIILDSDCPIGNAPAKIKRELLYDEVITIPDDKSL